MREMSFGFSGNTRMLTKKQEDFARYIFEGMSNREAYAKAGYSTNMALATRDVKAAEIAANGKVAVRLAELRKRAEDASVATVLERKQVLTEIVRGRVSQYITGKRISVTPDQLNSAAVQEVVTSEIQVGKGDNAAMVEVTKLKLRDPVSAISELNKMEHIYESGQTGETHNTQINIIVESERGQQLLQRVLKGERALTAGTVPPEVSHSEP
jgi:phage terminase small subunit